MRDDMFKVIVERPRRGSRLRTREGWRYRASEDVASKIGMKQGYVNRKWLNDNNKNAGSSRRFCWCGRIVSSDR
jgi:hypothetical protein